MVRLRFGLFQADEFGNQLQNTVASGVGDFIDEAAGKLLVRVPHSVPRPIGEAGDAPMCGCRLDGWSVARLRAMMRETGSRTLTKLAGQLFVSRWTLARHICDCLGLDGWKDLRSR